MKGIFQYFFGKLGNYYALKGDPLLAIKYAENGFQEAEKIQDIELMAPITCELCVSYFQAGEFSKMVDAAPRMLALLERTQRERDFFGARYNVYSGLCAHCAYAFAMLGNFEEGKVLCEKGLQFALDINKPYGLGWVESCYGNLFLTMGDGKNGIKHIQKCIRYLEETQASYIIGLSWAWLGHGYYLLGELETAKKYIEKGLKIHSDTGLPYFLALLYWLLSMVHFELSDLKNAQDCVEEALRLSQNRNERNYEGISKTWLGRILGKAEPSRGGRGEEYILQGIEILDELKLKPWSAQGYLFLGELYADRGQKENALENLKKAEGMFQEMGMDYWLARTEEILGRL